MSDFILDKPLCEHHFYKENGEIFMDDRSHRFCDILFQGKQGNPVYLINKESEYNRITTSYYIGVDWLIKEELAIQIEPKLDTDTQKTDFLKMLSMVLRHPGVSAHCEKLYEIKFDAPHIRVKKEADILTPLIVLRYIFLLKEIVCKGLRKDYRKIENNLTGKIKGKILVNQTIKKNHFQGKITNTFCRYQEYTEDCIENRLLKRALMFGQRYLSTLKIAIGVDEVNFIYPAFANVGGDVNVADVKKTKLGGIYHSYNEALRLAKVILQRFGYNINSISDSTMIDTPPFWIDMSVLFELYVLALLKDSFKSEVIYHLKSSGNELDFVLNSNKYKMVIDAKYRPKYISGKYNDDIRQVSGYARLQKIYALLGKEYPESIDCLIVYPDQENGSATLLNVDLRAQNIAPYLGVFKTGIKLPVQ